LQDFHSSIRKVAAKATLMTMMSPNWLGNLLDRELLEPEP
jgi:hypothetical protein